MQIMYLHKNIYKLANYACTQELLDKQILDRRKVLEDWEILKARGIPDCEIAKITGISRASYYRRKKSLKQHGAYALKKRSTKPRTFRKSSIPKESIDIILKLRIANPTYGKSKIYVLLKRDHDIHLSESWVGRVLQLLLQDGKIKRSVSSYKGKRRRNFKSHAKPWNYNMKA